MEYRCISADCHIDLSWLPPDLFTANATPAMKARMPRVVDGPEGPHWVGEAGNHLGYVCGLGSSGRKPIPGKEHRVDQMAATGLFEDAAKGIRRATTPQYRLQDQDRDGIQAEVIYSILNVGARVRDPDIGGEMYRIYNDWLADFVKYDRKRFVGLAAIPSHSVDLAVAEIKRVSKMGLGGLDVSHTWEMNPLFHSYWEPFWMTASEVNIPVHFHTIGMKKEIPSVPLSPKEELMFQASRMSAFQIYMANVLSSIIFSGTLERHPNLRIVLGESGIGWIPYVLMRMDEEWQDRYVERLDLKMKPSEYWKRQCRATFQCDYIGVKMLDVLGEENVMWGSDYPHVDGVFPDSQSYIKKQFSHLPAATQRKITCENVGRFYGLM